MLEFLSIIHVVTEPRCSNISLNLNMTTVNNHMQGYSPLNAALACISVSAKQLWGDWQGELLFTACVSEAPCSAGAPSSWSHKITRSRENYELTQERFLMQQQPCIEWYPDVNNRLIWACCAVHVNITLCISGTLQKHSTACAVEMQWLTRILTALLWRVVAVSRWN